SLSRSPCDLHSFPTRRSSDLLLVSRSQTYFSFPNSCLGTHVCETLFRVQECRIHRGLTRQREFGGLAFLNGVWERGARIYAAHRSEEHTSELQSPAHAVCRLL